MSNVVPFAQIIRNKSFIQDNLVFSLAEGAICGKILTFLIENWSTKIDNCSWTLKERQNSQFIGFELEL